MKEIVGGIEAIINQGVKGESDADYWKKIAKIIKDSGSKQFQNQSETKPTVSNNKPKPYCQNGEANTTYKNPGNCEVGDEGITFKEYAKWKQENTSTSLQAGGQKTHCYNPDTHTLTESRICQKKYRVTLEVRRGLGEARQLVLSRCSYQPISYSFF